jgi:hypothetical protein
LCDSDTGNIDIGAFVQKVDRGISGPSEYEYNKLFNISYPCTYSCRADDDASYATLARRNVDIKSEAHFTFPTRMKACQPESYF